MKMKTSVRPIVLTDSSDGFKYNIQKAQLKSGSTISKNRHPVHEVEAFKEKLLSTGRLKDVGDHYVLKRPINTGLPMARNLHYGRLINSKSPEWSSGGYFAVPEGDLLKDIQLLKLASYESAISKSYYLDSLKTQDTRKILIDFSDIQNHGDSSFSAIEQLFYDELLRRGVISKSSRHGIAKDDECDIVDEVNHIQIEVATVFKSRVLSSKTPQKDYDSIMLECFDNIFIKPSEALLGKYYTKQYTNNYKKQLAIYCIGNRPSVISLAKSMRDAIKDDGRIKNHFENIYIIWNDFANDNRSFIFYLDRNMKPIVDEVKTSVGLVKILESVNYGELDSGNQNDHYFWRANSIFNDASLGAMGILTSSDIVKATNVLHVHNDN